MAISWDIQITNVNVQSGRGNVTATRTDNESALPPDVYSFSNTPIKEPADRISLLNTIKQEVEKTASHNAQVDAIITDLEQSGKVQLEDWELTR